MIWGSRLVDSFDPSEQGGCHYRGQRFWWIGDGVALRRIWISFSWLN